MIWIWYYSGVTCRHWCRFLQYPLVRMISSGFYSEGILSIYMKNEGLFGNTLKNMPCVDSVEYAEQARHHLSFSFIKLSLTQSQLLPASRLDLRPTVTQQNHKNLISQKALKTGQWRHFLWNTCFTVSHYNGHCQFLQILQCSHSSPSRFIQY